MAPYDSTISVAILTGGKSRRMGRDKALLPWEGRPLIDHQIDVARSLRGAVETIIVGERRDYHGRGVPVVADRVPDAGPLGAIATALAAASNNRVLVLAVDLPLVSVRLLEAMVGLRLDHDAVVPSLADEAGARSRKKLQPLLAVYRKVCLPAIEERLAGDDRSMIGLLETISVRYLEPKWLRAYDRELLSFENVNTPDDLERARKLAARAR